VNTTFVGGSYFEKRNMAFCVQHCFFHFEISCLAYCIINSFYSLLLMNFNVDDAWSPIQFSRVGSIQMPSNYIIQVSILGRVYHDDKI